MAHGNGSPVADDTPTKPVVMTLPDYRARLAAYRAVQDSELGSLEGAVTTWDTVNLAIEHYLAALPTRSQQFICVNCNGEPNHFSCPDCHGTGVIS